jgi:hypothetical protein
LAVLESREKTRTLCLLKPVSMVVSLRRLRRKRPAAASRQDGECDLADDESRASGLRVEAVPPPRPSLRAGVSSRRVARRREDAEEQRGEDGEGEGESENGQVGSEVKGTGSGPGVAMLRSMGSLPGEGDAEGCSGEGEQRAFGEELEDDAGAGCSEGHANGDFAGAGDAAGEEHVGDVGAGDEQDQANDDHEDLERQRKREAQVREAVGGGGEFNAGVLDAGELLLGGIRADVVAAQDLLEEKVGAGAGLLD